MLVYQGATYIPEEDVCQFVFVLIGITLPKAEAFVRPALQELKHEAFRVEEMNNWYHYKSLSIFKKIYIQVKKLIF